MFDAFAVIAPLTIENERHMFARSVQHSFRSVAVFALSMIVSFCSTAQSQQTIPPLPERGTFTETDRLSATLPGYSGIRFLSDSVDDYKAALPKIKGQWLALSAGGSDGAFGAGFLIGWSGFGRPDFSLVTGASTGALIAVYAFLGSRYDAELKSAYTNITSADIYESATTAESLADTWPLQQQLEKRLTPELIFDLAKEHNAGRRLFVLTADLDLGKTIVWNIGAIAASNRPDSAALIRRILLASSSIPGIFKPVFFPSEKNGRKIYEMHVDGSVEVPFYFAPDALFKIPDSSHSLIDGLTIIINGSLKPAFSQTTRSLATILGRTYAMSIRSSEAAALALASRFSQTHNVPLRIESISEPIPQSSVGFDQGYMNALFQFGLSRGQKAFAMKSEPNPEHRARLP